MLIKKIWQRNKKIKKSMVNQFVDVHNGKKFITIEIKDNMVGHFFGEFAPSRARYLFKNKKQKKQR